MPALSSRLRRTGSPAEEGKMTTRLYTPDKSNPPPHPPHLLSSHCGTVCRVLFPRVSEVAWIFRHRMADANVCVFRWMADARLSSLGTGRPASQFVEQVEQKKKWSTAVKRGTAGTADLIPPTQPPSQHAAGSLVGLQLVGNVMFSGRTASTCCARFGK